MFRRRRAVAWALVAAGFASAAAGLALPSVAAHLVRGALPRVEERLERKIDVAEVSVRWGRVELLDVLVHGGGVPSPLEAPRVVIRFRVLPLLRGHLALDTVSLERPRITVVRNDKGEDNLTPLLKKLRKKDGAGEAGGGGGGHRSGPDEIRVEGGTLSVEDDALGSIEAGALDARIRREGEGTVTLRDVEAHLAAGPSARARQVVARIDIEAGKLAGMPQFSVEGGEARIWKGFAVSGVRGGVQADPESPGRAAIDLRGGYGGVDKVLWSAKGWADPKARQGALQLVAARFDLGQLAPILAGTPIQDPGEAQVDARLDLNYRSDPGDEKHLHDAVEFEGAFHLSGLNVFHPMLGPATVKHLGFDARAKGRLEPRGYAVHLDSADVDYRGLHAHLVLEATKLDRVRKRKAGAPGALTSLPAVKARLVVDPVPCQTALAAIPAELTPNLQGFKLQGTFKSEIHLDLDPDSLETMDLGSKIGIDGCNVLEAPFPVSADRLKATFEHAVEVEPGSWLAFPVGAENPEWVPFADISPNLINSIMTTEDSNFLQHKGFIGREFKSALKTNLEHGYFRLGASSITMQLVKNVLLTREKTLSRKLQELFLTWYMERSLSKARILEIYFNVIEYGPGIYGIGRAAKHYFGKLAKDLLPREAAFFSSILPSPKRRYIHYCKGPHLDLKWELYLNRILRRMHERGRLTDEEFTKAMDSRLEFDLKEAQPQDKCLDMVKRLSGGAFAQGMGVGIPIPLGRAIEADGAPGVTAPGGAPGGAPGAEPGEMPDPVPEEP